MKLAVIEGKWFNKRNTSVRGMFDLLSDIRTDSPHNYHYEMFNDATAFREIFLRLSATRGIHHIYVASHGNNNCLFGTNGDSISRTIIQNTIAAANKEDGRLDSIYFGCCLFGTQEILEASLTASGSIRWVAGYDKSVEFIASSALDWIFWNTYESTSGTPLKRITETVTIMKNEVPGLMTKLGFHVAAWDGKFKMLV